MQSLLRLTIRDVVPESYQLQVTRKPLENFESSLIRIKQGEKRKRCHPKSDFQLSQATHLSTKKPMNKLAMNNRLDSSCISFCTSSGKRQLKTS